MSGIYFPEEINILDLKQFFFFAGFAKNNARLTFWKKFL